MGVIAWERGENRSEWGWVRRRVASVEYDKEDGSGIRSESRWKWNQE